jgi:hypothetical protein
MRRLSVLLLCGMLLGSGCGADKAPVSRKMYFGFYQVNQAEKPDPVRFKSPLNLKPHVMAWSMDFSQPFPTASCDDFKRLGIVPMIRWEPWLWRDTTAITPADILAGKWDPYLKDWAAAVRGLDMTVLISFAPDFNSERYPWSIQNQGQNPDQYKALYRYVVTLFRQEGARNVVWVWGYLAKDTPDEEWNKPVLAYPGDDVVDWVGLASVNETDDLKVMFADALYVAAEQYAAKPIMITRFFYESTLLADKKMFDALNGPLSRVNAILLTNPKLLPKKENMLYTTLFGADIEEFNVLHLGM